MLQTLLESQGTNQTPRGRWTLGSLTAHTAIVLAAVSATSRHFMESPIAAYQPEPLGWVEPALDRSHAPVPARHLSVVANVPTIAIPDVPVLDAPAMSIPAPHVGLGEAVSAITRPSRAMPTPSAPDGVYSAAAVDRQVVPLSGEGSPRYPDALRSAGVEGEVVLRFVVDTTGQVEHGSISVLRSSHGLFDAAVRRWVGSSRFHPAHTNGSPVRQLVEQRFEFKLHP